MYILIGAYIIHTQQTHSSAQSFGLAKENLSQLRWAIPLYLAFLPLLGLVAILNQLFFNELLHIEIEHQAITQYMNQLNKPLHQIYIATAIFIAPLYEEILFRGILLPKITQKTGLQTPSSSHHSSLPPCTFTYLHFYPSSLYPACFHSSTGGVGPSGTVLLYT